MPKLAWFLTYACLGLARCADSGPMEGSHIFDDQAALRAYLSFGYLPWFPAEAPFAMLQGAGASLDIREREVDVETAVEEAAQLLSNFTEEGVTANPNGRHVVLLSGGFDSRAILGSLLKGVDRSRITACTYGYAGNEELELATRVARAAGVEHHRILIPETQWSTEELIKSAISRPFPPSFVVGARFQNFRIYRTFGTDCTFWDGFMGGAMSGASLKQPSAPADWGGSVQSFSRKAANSVLAPPDFDVRSALPARPICDPAVLAFDDQLNIVVRQSRYIANRIPSDYRTVAPFALEPSWRFWLGLPRHLRYGQPVYKQALGKAFPRLYATPIAGGRGQFAGPGWRRELSSMTRRWTARASRMAGKGSLRDGDPHRRTGHEMRDNKLLRAVISENIADLANRRLVTWLDPARVWSDHLSGVADHTEPMRVLTSLEICLKIQDAQARSSR